MDPVLDFTLSHQLLVFGNEHMGALVGPKIMTLSRLNIVCVIQDLRREIKCTKFLSNKVFHGDWLQFGIMVSHALLSLKLNHNLVVEAVGGIGAHQINELD